MRRRLIARLPLEDGYAYPDLERSASDRDLLLHAALDAGLQPRSVFDLAEALTGRPWARTGPPEIRVVARELLGAANRVAYRPSIGAHACAR
jgi:hypothetical protein